MAKTTSASGNIKAHSVGTVKGLTGSATATNANGEVRELHVGDKVDANEIIQTSAAGTVQIDFGNANFATVGHNSTLALDNTVFDPNTKPGHDGDVAKMQAKIAAGADPTDVTDASAAGPTAGSDGGTQGGHSAVFVQQNTASVEMVSGFETKSLSTNELRSDTALGPFDDRPTADDTSASLSDGGLISVADTGEIFTGTLPFIFGADGAGSVGFAGMALIANGGTATTGGTATVGMETVSYNWDNSSHTLTATVIGGDRDGTPLFKVVVTDPVTGEYTVTLTENVIHAAGQGENDATTTLTFTVADSDGDTDAGTLTITFNDDVPTVTVEGVTQAELPQLITHDADTIGPLVLPPGSPEIPTEAVKVIPLESMEGQDSVSASFASLFNLTYDMGADDGGTVPTLGYSLSVTNSDSTLYSNGNAITLIKGSDGNIIGQTSVDGVTTDIFQISVDNSGNVTLTQYQEIDHVGDNGSNSVSHISLANGTITLTASTTIVDGDGDSASSSHGIDISSAFHFIDDVPTVSPNLFVVLDDDALPGGNPGSVLNGDFPLDTFHTEGTLSHNFGADGTGSIAWKTTDAPEGFVYETDASGTLLVKQNGSTVITVTLDSTTGDYKVTQVAAIDHDINPFDSPNLENNQGFALTYTVTDGDGDKVDGSINLVVNDDTPTTSINKIVLLDDDALASGNSGGTFDINPDTANIAGTLSHNYGADGGSIAWKTTGAPSGFAYETDASGTLLVKQNGSTVITVTLDSATGDYKVTQVAAIDHDANPFGLPNLENNQGFALTYTITDGDGDHISNVLLITVNDDSPTVSSNLLVQLDDDALLHGNAGGNGDVTPDTANLTGFLSHSYGADGGSVAWDTSARLPSGFAYATEGGNLVIKQSGTTVLTLTLNSATGEYTVTQNAAIHHVSGQNENDLSFTLNYTATDGDGDKVNGLLAIKVDDDSPTVSSNVTVQLDDDALLHGNTGGTGDVTPDTANISGTLSHSYGADGAGTIAWDKTASLPTGFTYGTDASGNLVINQGATKVMTLTLNSATGEYTVTQNAAIHHAAGGDENNQDFTLAYTVTDGDGDKVGGSLAISVNDDSPTVGNNLLVQLDDDTLAGGNSGGTGDITPDTANLTGILSHSYGADGGPIAWDTTVSLPEGFTYGTDANGNLTIHQGATTVMTLTLDSATGAYTVTQNAAIHHADGSNENDQSFTLNYTVTDGDGDKVGGTLAISVNDDSPVVNVTDGIHSSTMPTMLTGDLSNIGADVTGSHVEWTGIPSGLFSNGVAVTLINTGDTITGTAGGKTVFTLEVDNHLDGTYGYNYTQHSQLSTASTINLSQDLDDSYTYFGYSNGTLASTENANNWLVKLTAYDGDLFSSDDRAYVNPNTPGLGAHSPDLFGSGNETLNGLDEYLVLEFNASTNETSAVTIDVNGLTDSIWGERLFWTATMEDGTTRSGVIEENGLSSLGTFSITANDGTYVENVVLHGGMSTSVSIGSITVYNQSDLSFGFNATDGDNDSVSGSVTIDGDLVVTNDAPTVITGTAPTVYESGLNNIGSNGTENTETASSTFTIHDDQGLSDLTTITIAGQTFNIGAGGLAALIGQTVSNDAHDTIKITGYSANANGTDGTFTYEYTLKAAGSTTVDSFNVTVSDGASSATKTVTANIADDAPVAHNDVHSQTETSSVTYSGADSLTANDNYGADGAGHLHSATVGSDTHHFSNTTDWHTFNLGTAGTVTIYGDGHYTYTTPNVKDAASATVSYVLQDKEGTQSAPATLILSTADRSEVAPEIDTNSASGGYWTAGSLHLDTASATTYDWSPGTTNKSYSDSIDPSYVRGSDSSATKIAISADATHHASITGTVDVSDYKSGDVITLTLLDPNGNVVGSKTFAADGSFTFGGLTTSGQYTVVLYGEDKVRTGMWPFDSSDLEASININASSYTYTPTTQTISLSTPDIASANGDNVYGNVRTNDSQGSEGATISAVFSEVASSVLVTPTGINIVGQYGTLHLESDGDYTYTPTVNTIPAGAEDVFTYTLSQADGDAQTATLTISLTEHAYSNTGTAGNDWFGSDYGGDTLYGQGGNDHLVGNANANNLYGGDNADKLEGNGGADQLYGNAGSDYLLGGIGNDILVGGAGDDILTGGTGSDTFRYQSGDLTGLTNGDIITDFKVDTIANGGDVLDLSAVLGSGHPDSANGLISGGWLKFEAITQNTDGTTTLKLSIDTNGNASGGTVAPLATITMSGVSGLSGADILNKLLTNHEITL